MGDVVGAVEWDTAGRGWTGYGKQGDAQSTKMPESRIEATFGGYAAALGAWQLGQLVGDGKAEKGLWKSSESVGDEAPGFPWRSCELVADADPMETIYDEWMGQMAARLAGERDTHDVGDVADVYVEGD
jgi:hypothetical protein